MDFSNLPDSPYWHSLLPGGEPVQFSMGLPTFSQEVDVAIIGGGLTGMSCAVHALE